MTTPNKESTSASGPLPQPADNWPAAETVPRSPQAATPPCPAKTDRGAHPSAPLTPGSLPASPQSSTMRGIRRRPTSPPLAAVDDATRPRQTPPPATPPQLHTITPATPPGGATLATPPPLTPAGGAPLGACPPPATSLTASSPLTTPAPTASSPPPAAAVPAWSMSVGPGETPSSPPVGPGAPDTPSTPPWLQIVGAVGSDSPDADDDEFRVEDAVSPYRGATNPYGTALPRALAAARRKNVLVVGACLLTLGVGIGGALGAFLFSKSGGATAADTNVAHLPQSALESPGTEEVLAAAPELATPQETAGRHENRTAVQEDEGVDAQETQIPADAFLPVDPATLPTQVPGLEFEASPPYTYWTKSNDPLLISSLDASAAKVAAARDSSTNVVDFSGGFCGEVAGMASCYVIPGKAPERYYLLTANGRLTDDLVTLGRAIADYR